MSAQRPCRAFSWRSFLVSVVSVGLATTPLEGAGFAIIEQGVSGLGNGYAGAAAVAEDASTIFYNPAGMILLDRPQVESGMHVIIPSAEFINEGSLSAFGTPFEQPTTGPNDDGGEIALVPNLYYAHPVSERLVLGVGLHAPFGLSTDYEDDWVGRYLGLKSAITTITFAPSAAYRINDYLTIGVGLNLQYAEAELSSAIDFGFIAAGVAAGVNAQVLPGDPTLPIAPGTYLPQTLDGKVEVKGDDLSVGVNIGLLIELSEQTRFGIHYRSHVDFTLEGDADFNVPSSLEQVNAAIGAPILAAGGFDFSDGDAEAPVTLPESISLSAYHELNSQWAVLGDITWMRWSRFETLLIDYNNPATPDTVVPENWEDVFRYSLGAIYKHNEEWTFRTGLVFDQSPVFENQYRSPRIPDEDRYWVTLGVSYQWRENIKLHLAYVHIFVDDPIIDNTTHTTGQYIHGTIDASVDIISAGLTWEF